MKWNDLSNDAKAVIEWVENPFTKQKEHIEIQVGVHFQRDVPAFAGEPSQKVNIPITMSLFSEIIKFVASDNDLETVSFDADLNKFSFKLRDHIQLH